MAASSRDAGFLQDGEDPAGIDDQADDLLATAASWPLGTVVERRGDIIQVRQWPPRPRA
ncbi:DUF7715 family protein [Saccharomonospora saliphila]|uniref:DUF7715 family protein n=1 Tax=Saccharomonospora saliphila TaxID=369829 RepID=UPI000361DD60|nr:hypothetical protein [Saccharomonospora saliphila]